jgi:acetyl esterase/lipase
VLLAEFASAQPLPAGVAVTAAALGGVPAAEITVDDAIRLARQAATADVQVTLDITAGVPHVFQAYYPILDEAAAALDRAGQLLSAHLASVERVHHPVPAHTPGT